MMNLTYATAQDGIEGWYLHALRRERRRILITTFFRRYLFLIILALIDLAFVTLSGVALHSSNRTMREGERLDAVILSIERNAESRHGDCEVSYKFIYKGKPAVRTMKVTGADLPKLSDGTRFDIYVGHDGRVMNRYDQNYFRALCWQVSMIVAWVPWGIILFIILYRMKAGLTPRRTLKKKLALIREFIAGAKTGRIDDLFLAYESSVKIPRIYSSRHLRNAQSPSRVIPLHGFAREAYPPLPMRTLEEWLRDQPRPWDYETYVRHLECALQIVYPAYLTAPVPERRFASRYGVILFNKAIRRPFHREYSKSHASDWDNEPLPDYDAFYLDLRHGDLSLLRKKAEAEWIVGQIVSGSQRRFNFELARRRCNLAREIDAIDGMPSTFPVIFARAGEIIETRRVSPNDAWRFIEKTIGRVSNPAESFVGTAESSDPDPELKHVYLNYKPGSCLIAEWSKDELNETTVDWNEALIPPPSFPVQPPAVHPCARWSEWLPYFPLYALALNGLGLMMFFFMFGLFLSLKYSTVNENEGVLYSLRYSIPLWAVYSIASGLALYYSADSYKKRDKKRIWHLGVAVSVMAFFAALPLFFSCWTGIEIINGALDAAPPTTHRVRVLEKEPLGDKAFFRYLVVQSWRPERTSEKIRVPEEIYNRAGKNALLDVTTKPGRLGLEWVKKLAAVSAAK
ncbi:DUF3592 domain-containing protein [bacterium]|nr:DUF3592 domain-containing protein [bacterium]